MSHKAECTVCHKIYYARRVTSKYCSERCKQSAKYRRTNNVPVADVHYMLLKAENSLEALHKFMNDETMGTDAKIRINSVVDNLRHVIDKTTAKGIVIESQRFDRWFECRNCGQKVFGRVEKCDFCAESDFKTISMVNKS